MDKVSYSEMIKRQGERLNPAYFKKGVVSAVYIESWSADVRLVGSQQDIIKNVPISLALSPSDVKIGDRCRIDVFDESNPLDVVLSYTYGRAKYKKINSGVVTALAANTNKTIAHGLGRIPDIVAVSGAVYLTGTPQVGGIYEYQSADANNIYVTNQNETALDLRWYAAIIE